MAQGKRSLEELIFGLNETMVGRFDAMGERIEKLESTLTDDALALSSEHEALIAGLRQQLDDQPDDWEGGPNQYLFYMIFSMLCILIARSGLEVDSTIEIVRESVERTMKNPPA